MLLITQTWYNYAIIQEGMFNMVAAKHIRRKYSINEIKKILGPVFRKNGVKSAVLFGSYSRGQETPDSDIDILVDSQLRGLAFFGLLEDVVNALHKEVDLIDTRQLSDDSYIKDEIKKNGIEIYAA